MRETGQAGDGSEASACVVRGVVFDMDDTLYLEREYVRSGFQAVAASLERCGLSPEKAFDFLWEQFERGVRGDTFNRLLDAYPQLKGACSPPELIEIYRAHVPSLSLAPEIHQLLEELRKGGLKLGLISDGPLASQSAKFKSLRLEPHFDLVVLTDEWGREFWKPHPRSFESIMEAWDMKPRELVYVADNPVKDFLAPKRLGWHTVRLRLSEQQSFAHAPASPDHAPDREVSSIAEMIAACREFCAPLDN